MAESNPEMTVIKTNEILCEACEGHNDTITITAGPYDGLKFRYDKTWFDPVTGLGFHYTVLNGTLEVEEDFEHAIAHLLCDMTNEKLASGELVFHGGTDSTADEAMKILEELDHKKKPAPKIITDPNEPAIKNIAQQIMARPGVFTSKQGESAMSFLDQLAAQGQAAMGKS